MIWQTLNSIRAALLLAAVAIATSLPATARQTNAAPLCAPTADDSTAKSKSSSATAEPARTGPSVSGKQGAKAADANDDNDDKDFPPLKPGESFHLIGFSLTGSKHVDEDALIATLPEHQGDAITQVQVTADTKKIKAALTARHVHFAEVTTAFLQRAGSDHCVWVEWGIQHIDAFSRVPYQGYWKFGGQTFSGNRALSNEQLAKAIDLQPGERVREGAISDAITGMQQAYDKVFRGQPVKISGKLKLTLKPVRVANFEWLIVEPAAKKRFE